VTTTTVQQPVRGALTAAPAEVRNAHLATADAVAELDLDDALRWRESDGFVADLAAAAYRLTAELTGSPQLQPAARVPPVVRVRELATAQRRLFAALDRHPAPSPEVLGRASRQVQMLGRALRSVARSTQQ
jgi:hypothetical protein